MPVRPPSERGLPRKTRTEIWIDMAEARRVARNKQWAFITMVVGIVLALFIVYGLGIQAGREQSIHIQLQRSSACG